VLEYKSDLTGVTAADLEGVSLTRKGAAKRIAALLTPNTVLVGHSLHYDLASLKLDHTLVIDTSMIFSIK
jgi:RNA exonuclease 1